MLLSPASYPELDTTDMAEREGRLENIELLGYTERKTEIKKGSSNFVVYLHEDAK